MQKLVKLFPLLHHETRQYTLARINGQLIQYIIKLQVLINIVIYT